MGLATTLKYTRWDAEGVEAIPPSENDDHKRLVEQINETQRRFYEKNGHCFGGTHARTQGIVKGTFSAPDDLPPYLKQTELFEKGGDYPFAARYSSEPSDPKLDDTIAQPRGLAMKIFDVNGAMFEAGKDAPTQDIEFNSTPAIDLSDSRTTKEILDLRLKYGYNTTEQIAKIRERSDAELQEARNQVSNLHLAAVTFYSQTAYRFGDFVMKYRLLPISDEQKRLQDEPLPANRDGVLHESLRGYYQKHDAVYLFQAQLLENLDDQPVEYSGTEWDSKKYPFETIAEVFIPRQESWDERRNRFWVDKLRVDPWLGLVKLQPLGSSNRVRRTVYPASSKYRRSLNGVAEVNAARLSEIPGY